MIFQEGRWWARWEQPVALLGANRALLADEVGFERDGRLRDVFGGELPWLLFAVASSGPTPESFGEPVEPPFEFLGVVSQVRVLSTSRFELKAPFGRVTGLRELVDLAAAAGNPLLYRFVTVVADQYDKLGRRVQRVTGARVRLTGVEIGGAWDGVSVGAEAMQEPLGWWSAVPVKPVDRDDDDIDVRAFGANEPTRGQGV